MDHLANGIENQWLENQNLSFDDALTREFRKFGIFGFSEIVEEKQIALARIYRKEIWKHLKEYLKLPKIIITGFSIWALFELLQFVEIKQYVVVFLIVSMLVIFASYSVKESKRIKKVKKETGKLWLFENMNLQFGLFIGFFNISLNMSLFNFDSGWGLLGQLAFSIGVVIFSLIFYILVKIVKPNLKQKYAKENPDYKFI